MGNVAMTTDRWHRLKPNRTYAGHLSVMLWSNGTPRRHFIHRLVLVVFVGPCPEGSECCHWDGNPGNNRLTNLRWDTPQANAADAARHGRIVRGEAHPSAKVTAATVRNIRGEYAAGGSTFAKLARKHGVTRRAIVQIVRRQTWKHVV